ncbi:hypothetical protein JCM21900_002701 [Sporobolomyces salmonicolor]
MDFELTPAPHPSYALESSSGESDWAEDELPVSARSALPLKKHLAPEAVVSLQGNAQALKQGTEVVFLVGEAGERIAQGVEVGREMVEVYVDGEQQGAIYQPSLGPTLVFLSTALPLASLHPLASFLLDTLTPSHSTILSSYYLPSYNPPTITQPLEPASRLPILYLSSPSPSPSSSITQLRNSSILEPFTPPNLLHGLPSILLMLSALRPSASSTLLLLPTTTIPQPLNGPFSLLSPVTQPSSTTLYDAGGPTGLGDSGGIFRELAADGRLGRGKLQAIKDALGWSWWNPEEKAGGRGFDWLETQRRARRRDEASSMFM